ncbi:MAG: TonB-dependent receptor [Pseudomonadota bacterium]
MIKTSLRCLAALLICAPAVADDVLNEIVVTADYRERPLQDVAASITLLDAEQIDALGDQHFEELIKSIPNLNWSGDGNRARYLQIRGVGERSQYEGAPNPSIGFLIDDIDFSGIGTVATLFDVERIEVLRGPQGTRYGANALGGLIYIRTAAPDAPARVEASVADDDTLSLAAAFGGTLSDSWSFRFSAQSYESNGFRDNAFLGRDDTNGRDEQTARLKLRYTPSDVFTADATLLLADMDNGYDAFAIDNSLTMLSDKPGRDAQQSTGLSLALNWAEFAGARLTSITTVADSDIDFSFDADWGSEPAWAPITYDFTSLADRERLTISQELRLTSTAPIFGDSTDWLFGVYALNLDEDFVSINEGTYIDPAFSFSDSLFDELRSNFESTNVALFGQLDIALGERTRLTTGLRLERRNADYADTAGLDESQSETMWGGELSLSHEWSSATTVYSTLSAGFKAGGFNLGFVPEELRDFFDERMWNVELGVKHMGERHLVNAAVFYNRRDDQQVRTSFQVDPGDPASFIFITGNAAEGKTLGAEIEAQYFASDSVTLWLAVGLLNAEFDEYNSPLADLSGRGQAHAPDYTASAGVSWDSTSGWFVSANASAVDAFYFGTSHDNQSEAYALADARIGFRGDAWTATLWARNLFDERYAVRGFFFGNEPPDFEDTVYTRAGDPRLVGATLEWRF